MPVGVISHAHAPRPTVMKSGKRSFKLAARESAGTEVARSNSVQWPFKLFISLQAAISRDQTYRPKVRPEPIVFDPIFLPGASSIYAADMSSVRERRQYPHSAGNDAPEAGTEADGRLDFLTVLLPEMAINILRFLQIYTQPSNE